MNMCRPFSPLVVHIYFKIFMAAKTKLTVLQIRFSRQQDSSFEDKRNCNLFQASLLQIEYSVLVH